MNIFFWRYVFFRGRFFSMPSGIVSAEDIIKQSEYASAEWWQGKVLPEKRSEVDYLEKLAERIYRKRGIKRKPKKDTKDKKAKRAKKQKRLCKMP